MLRPLVFLDGLVSAAKLLGTVCSGCRHLAQRLLSQAVPPVLRLVQTDNRRVCLCDCEPVTGWSLYHRLGMSPHTAVGTG